MEKKSAKVFTKLILPLSLAGAILLSTVTTLVVWNLSESRNRVPEGYLSISDVQALLSAVTLPAGYLEGSGEEISLQAGEEIQQAVARMEDSWVDGPPDGAAQIQSREWSSYASRLAKEPLSFKEAAFYDRLDEMCQAYLTSSARDGVYYEYDDPSDNCYATAGVSYSDLNLTSEQAGAVRMWFKYNNPQYYFLTGSYLYTKDKLFLVIGDFAASGEERAAITNELFDKLDGWIAEVNSGAATTWQKELAANNLLCREIVYHDPFTKGGEGSMGQTLYSAVILQKTVCAGYAQAFSAMMNASGIDTVVALSPTHAWNVSRMDDGNFYCIDSTWNDNENNDNAPYNDYFNVGDKASKAGDGQNGTHTYDSDFAAWTPAISETDYEPSDYDRNGGSGSALQLAAPRNLRITYDKDSKVGLQWDAVDQATGYTVEVYTDSGMHERLASTPVETTAVAVTYNDSCPTLALRVRATAVSGGVEYASEWSDLLETKTKAGQSSGNANAPLLSAPKNVRTDSNEPTSTMLSWDPVEGAEKYELTLFKDSSYKEPWTTGYTNEPALGYVSLEPNTTYYYGVRAVKTVDGRDQYSEWTYYSETTPAGTTQAPAPEKPDEPENITVEAISADKAMVNWDAAPGASGYEVIL